MNSLFGKSTSYLWLFGLSVFLLLGSTRVFSEPLYSLPDTTHIDDAVQDQNGEVYGIAYDSRNELRHWLGDRWEYIKNVLNEKNAQPLMLSRSPRHGVVCIWNIPGSDLYYLSWRQGQNTISVRFTFPLRSPLIFPDTSGSVWITDINNNILRVDMDGVLNPVFKLTEAHYIIYGSVLSKECDPIAAIEDARGNMWFWSDYMKHAGVANTIRGAIMFDGKSMRHRPEPTSLQTITVMRVKDADNIWLTDKVYGLKELNVVNVEKRRYIRFQPRADTKWTQDIFMWRDNWYVITGEVYKKLYNTLIARKDVIFRGYHGDEPAPQQSKMWLYNNSKWQMLIDGVDEPKQTYDQAKRAKLVTEDGLWLGSFGKGAWFFPSDGKPTIHIMPSRCFPLATTNCLFKIGDNSILAIEYGRGSYVINAVLVVDKCSNFTVDVVSESKDDKGSEKHSAKTAATSNLTAKNDKGSEKHSAKIVAISNLTAMNVTDGDAGIVADWLRGEMVKAGELDVVEREQMDKILSEYALQNTGCTSKECSIKLGKLLNAQFIVVGSYGLTMGKYVLNVRVVEVGTGKALYSDTAMGESDMKLIAAIKALAVRLNGEITTYH